MKVQHNIPALNSHRNLLINNSATAKNLEKLSSGFRINRAADDAAGLAISEKMRSEIRGLGMAEMNCQNAVNLVQTAEGGLQETHAILGRMRELAVQAANGTYDANDRANLEMELQQLKSEIDRIAGDNNYNNIQLLDGTIGAYHVNAGAATSEVTDELDKIFTGPGADIQIDYTGNPLSGSTQTATVIVRDDGSMGLIVGGQAFLMDSTPVFPGVYAFKDQDGNPVAELTITGGSLPTAGEAPATIANIQPGAAVANPVMEGVRIAAKGSELIFQIGAYGGNDQQVGCAVNNMSTLNIGDVAAGTYIYNITIADIDDANAAIDVIAAATNQVSGQRASLGALQNRMEHTLNSLGVTKENLTASESTIRDSDMAKEMMEFTKNNILVQSAQAMLAQASQLPQGILQLLQ